MGSEWFKGRVVVLMQKTNSNTSLPHFGWLILAVIMVWAVFNIAVWVCLPSWSERGQFGDMFGGVNALFSALAFAAVAYAILLQRNQLVAQEHDLVLSAQLNATSALIAAYTECARYADSRSSPDTAEVTRCQKRIKELTEELEKLLKEVRDGNA